MTDTSFSFTLFPFPSSMAGSLQIMLLRMFQTFTIKLFKQIFKILYVPIFYKNNRTYSSGFKKVTILKVEHSQCIHKDRQVGIQYVCRSDKEQYQDMSCFVSLQLQIFILDQLGWMNLDYFFADQTSTFQAKKSYTEQFGKQKQRQLHFQKTFQIRKFRTA